VNRLRRLRFAATPPHAWPTNARKLLGRTRVGVLLKRRRTARPTPEPPSVHPRRAVRGRNVLLVSHCDFTGNSAYHVHAIARELGRLGWSPAVAVPGSPGGARELGPVDFPIVAFRDVRRGRLRFPDGRGVDLVHAFTPREVVRRLTRELGVPYVVHLEDNEAAVRGALRMPADESAEGAFVAGAVGATVVIERLLELVPEGLPAAVVWPGYDERLDRPGRPRNEIRRHIGLHDDQFAVVYTGNVHEANVDEVRELYLAVERLRREGDRVVLVKSGWNSVPRSRLPRLGAGVLDLGWIRRERVLELIRAADALVQPGAPGPFNDYRFPSKLPDYLASGNPVVLPRTNVGLVLEESDAVLLKGGDAACLSAAITRLVEDADRGRALGEGGRRFALARLRWSDAAAAAASVLAPAASG
jgi:glycosyltransferase involved in cell wall biosynthesis